MSYVFENNKADNQTVWWPSNAIALTFLDDVRALEKNVGRMSGMKESASNMISIEPDLLREFAIAAVHFWSDSNNQSLKLLLHGAILHLIALSIACGNDLNFEGLKLGELQNDARKLFGSNFEQVGGRGKT